MTRRTTRAALALAGGLVAALVAVPAAPAYAAPVAAPDRATVYAGASYVIDVLDNDETTIFSVGELTLCGFTNETPGQLYVEQTDDGKLRVETNAESTGTISFTYNACQRSQTDTARVTLTLRTLADLGGAKKRRPLGKVVFTNPNGVDVKVRWGSTTNGRADGMRTVPARGSIVVTTTRRAIYWLGLLQDGDALVTAGDGVIRDIAQPRKRS